MSDVEQLLSAVGAGKSLNRRQLRLALRRRGLVRMWTPTPEEVITDWPALVTRGVGKVELTPRGRVQLSSNQRADCNLQPQLPDKFPKVSGGAPVRFHRRSGLRDLGAPLGAPSQ